MTLNEAFPQMKRAIVQVWQAIGPDIIDHIEEDNVVAVESCMDAGRFDTFVSAEMQELLHVLVDAYGYPTVLEYCSNRICLV